MYLPSIRRESLMEKQPLKIAFDNQLNPSSRFDLINLEDLLQRTDIDHDVTQLHLVEFYILIYITEGHSYHTIDFTDYKLEKGTILTIRKDQLHKFFRSTSVKGYMVLFTDEFLVSYLEKLEAQKTMLLFNELLAVPKIQLTPKEAAIVSAIILRMENEYHNLMDSYTPGILRSELHILITTLFRIKATTHQTISGKRYLEQFIQLQNLVEAQITTSRKASYYANLLGVSTKTLNTITKSIANKSAKAFIDEISIKQIKRKLINTNLSIKEIAFSSGFEETTNFYKYFKREMGTTPEQFRAAY